jgi:xylose isomerase
VKVKTIIAAPIKFSVGVWALSSCTDRFCTHGYRDSISTIQAIQLAAKIKGMEAMVLSAPGVVGRGNCAEVKKALKDSNLKVSSVDSEVSGAEFKNGAFTSSDPAIRRRAVEVAKCAADMARELGSPNMGIWPGQDGFDYPFQAEYEDLWKWTVESVREVGEYARDLHVCVEYKPKEPRKFITVADVGKVLLLCSEVGLENVGATLDFGHALMAKENPSESACLLARRGRLFSVHMNDAYRDDDDDMTAGSVNFWETLELLWWLDRLGYEGYFAFDIFPAREDLVRICELNIRNMQTIGALARKLNTEELHALLHRQDVLSAHELLRSSLF